MSADSALRANVRLLGELLGAVLVEQEGSWLLELEERVRALARAGREGDAAAAAALERVHRHRAGEITILWQTDEVRSLRPRVVDEIRNGHWFVEESLWGAAPRLLAELRARVPGAGSPLRFGTWIGGDLDGNPHAGAETVEEALERGRALARELLRHDVRELARSWGMSTTVVDADA